MTDIQRRTVVTALAATGAVVSTGDALSRANGFTASLLATAPHPSLGRHSETFGRLIGSWTGEYRDRDAQGAVETGTLEVHFSWVLEGRAVQDIWIAPPRPKRAGSRLKRQTYGTTIRVFHPQEDAWRAVWLNPVSGVRTDLIGHRVGSDIVQFVLDAARPEKWVFTQITAQSFAWHAFVLDTDGATWRPDTEFQLRRTA